MKRTFCKFVDHVFAEDGTCQTCPMLKKFAEYIPDEPIPLTEKQLQHGRRVAYFREHPNDSRFRVIPVEDAAEMGLPTDGYDQHRYYCNGLYDFKDEANPFLVGVDGGEPEDQTFNRDLRWLVQLLNDVAKED